MNKFNRSRANRESRENQLEYKVGDLVWYSYEKNAYVDTTSWPPDLAIVLSKLGEQYVVKFLDDGSLMDAWGKELSAVEQSNER